MYQVYNNIIKIVRGTAADVPVALLHQNGREHLFQDGDVLTLTVRASVGSAILLQKTVADGVIRFTEAETGNLRLGSYLYDLQLDTALGWRDTVVDPHLFVICTESDIADVEYYRRLLTSEYRNSPRLNEWLLWLLHYGQDAEMAARNIISLFDLDVATGVQLDTLGAIAGVPRTLNFMPSGGYSPVLEDETYRLIIRAAIIRNVWKGTIEELYNLWYALFTGGAKLQVHDNQDMSFNITLMGEFTTLERELISHGYIIPKPEGVRINLLTIVDTEGLPLFAYDRDTYMESGYTAHWAEPEEVE